MEMRIIALAPPTEGAKTDVCGPDSVVEVRPSSPVSDAVELGVPLLDVMMVLALGVVTIGMSAE